MKSPFFFSALMLCGCINANLETTARDHHEFDLVSAPVNSTIEVGFQAGLSSGIGDALKKAEEPTNALVDSVTLDGSVISVALSTDTTLAGIYGCQIALSSSGGTVTIVEHELSDRERSGSRLSLPLENATLADVRPVLEQSGPTLGLTLQLRPAELSASKVMTDIAIELSADLEASL